MKIQATKKSGTKKRKLIPLRRLHKKAWNLWSKKRRLSAANFQGYVTCITCCKQFPWQELHLGHFKHYKLDFDKINTNPQCAGCNTYWDGKLDVYALRLIDMYGLEEFRDLAHRANVKGNNYSRSELEIIIKSLTS